jgi:predicted nucleotidyltransferase
MNSELKNKPFLVKQKFELEEDIEKHDELNPALFNEDSTLKSEVKDKITEIVDEFLKDFIEVEIDLKVEDIILTGSNASYNYTKDSDLDIHIIADTSEMEDTAHLYKVIYDAYKSAFNKKFDIELNKVPVEIYVETEDSARVSNGVYSVKDNDWIKEPELTDIPELDQEAFDKLYQEWEAKCKDLIKEIEAGNLEDEADIVTMIEDIYELRKSGISEGEYSIQNLVFKELRNNKYLDDLKEYKDELIAKRLSL